MKVNVLILLLLVTMGCASQKLEVTNFQSQTVSFETLSYEGTEPCAFWEALINAEGNESP